MLISHQVHDMMDDIAEQQEVAREISDAISNPVAFGQDIDEDELEKELEELEQEELDKELIMADTPAMLPNPPTAEPAVPARPSRPVPARRHVRENCFAISWELKKGHENCFHWME